jgi:microsomal dipeptidase-like Zn-dependent dipeptidase
MEKRGFSATDIDKVAGGNWRRLFSQSFGPAA